MTWIQHTNFADSQGELRDIYEKTYALYPPEYAEEVPAVMRPDGSADKITAAHSLIPQALWHGMSTHGVLMSPDLPLSRGQHEMIATVVSALNSCFYWVESHAEFFRRVSLDDKLAAQLRVDYTKADLSEADRAMLDYTAKLTRHAWKTTPEDLDQLRTVGFDDRAILQINLIASWFNYINRVADGLGVGK